MKFENYLVPEFISLVENINNQGFKVGVVGGTVRDFLLSREPSFDYDCELRLINSSCDLVTSFEALVFPDEIKVSKLPYKILRLEHSTFSCELSMPRIETFHEGFSHSNFSASFSNSLDYKESFKRRDFTINAMMYEFNGRWDFVDPFEGKDDLEKKKLKACSDDFSKDPVRFLRALRFSQTLGFKIDEEILAEFKRLNRDNISAHYLRQEALKTKAPITYAQELLKLIGTPLKIDEAKTIKKLEGNILDIKKHLSSVLFLEAETRKSLCDFFDYSIKIEKLYLPLQLGELKTLDLNCLIALDLKVRVINTIRELARLEPVYFNALFELGLIDLSLVEFRRFNSISVDLFGVENSEKRFVQLLKRVESYFGS